MKDESPNVGRPCESEWGERAQKLWELKAANTESDMVPIRNYELSIKELLEKHADAFSITNRELSQTIGACSH